MIKVCPECGGDKFKMKDNTHCECRYCGNIIDLEEQHEVEASNNASDTIVRPSDGLVQKQPDTDISQTAQNPVQAPTQQNVFYNADGTARVIHPVYVQQPQSVMVATPEKEKMPSTVMLGIAFFIPIVGFVLYFKKRKQSPLSAKAYLVYASVAIGVNFIFGIILRSIGNSYLATTV